MATTNVDIPRLTTIEKAIAETARDVSRIWQGQNEMRVDLGAFKTEMREFRTGTRERFDRLDTRMDRFEARMDRLEAKMDVLIAHFGIEVGR